MEWLATESTESLLFLPRESVVRLLAMRFIKSFAVCTSVTFWLVLANAAAAEESARRPSLDDALAHLRDKDPKVRLSSIETVKDIAQGGLTPQEGLRVITAAASLPKFTAGEAALSGDVCDRLIWILTETPNRAYVPAIVEAYPNLSEKAKANVCVVLQMIDTREAAEAIMNIMERHAKAGRVPRLELHRWKHDARFADVLFPKLLEYASGNDAMASDIDDLALAYCDKGALKTASLEPYATAMARRCGHLRDELMPLQRDRGIDWMFADNYEALSGKTEILLDLMGHVHSPEIDDELHKALGYRDPRLKTFSILSLLRQGQTVAASDVANVAASAEMRCIVFSELEKLGKLALMPDRFKTQKALAEGDMVQWLAFETELGRPPDEIELMKVIPAPGEKGAKDWYVFRYRTTEVGYFATKDGWLAGIAGPFSHDGPPSNSGSGTFSSFNPWEKYSAEEHLQKIVGKDDK